MTGEPHLQLENGPPSKLSSAVYDTIRQAILEGRFPPGYRLRENHLASEIGVSPTPVREALHRLDSEGLVMIVPHRGAVVARWTEQDVRDLYELRALMEGWAIEQVADRAASLDLEPITALLKEGEAAMERSDEHGFSRLDVEFHTALVGLSGNRHLATLTEQVHRRIQTIRSLCAVYLAGRQEVSHRQHLAILAAIQNGERYRAQAAIRSHIEEVCSDVLAAMRRSSRSEGPRSPASRASCSEPGGGHG